MKQGLCAFLWTCLVWVVGIDYYVHNVYPEEVAECLHHGGLRTQSIGKNYRNEVSEYTLCRDGKQIKTVLYTME